MREKLLKNSPTKFGKLALALLMVVFSLSLAFSQDDVMELRPDVIKDFERPLVQFPHAKHADVINCSQCHHDYDKFKNNLIKGEEDVTGQRCSECHDLSAGSNSIPLVEAYHMQCKGCHEDMRAEGKKSGPVTCGDCHVRN